MTSDEKCVTDCVATGTAKAQAQWQVVEDCLKMACPYPDRKCACDSQCTPAGACKKANEDCIGMSPDPDCAKLCT